MVGRAEDATAAGPIPPILHQTWKTADIPAQYREAVRSWRDRHPGWTHLLWTDADIERFVAERHPELRDLFRRYPEPIQRADAVRYLVLHDFGGAYSDLDIESLRPVDELRRHEAVLPKTAPVGLSNDFMMAAPGHPLFRELIDGLDAAFARWQRWYVPRHFRVLLTTGSLYLTRGFRRHTRKDRILVLPPELYSSQDRERAYVYHLPGNTWAGWDTHLFLFIAARWRWIAAAAAVAALLALL